VVEGFEVKRVFDKVLEDVELRVFAANGAAAYDALVEHMVFGVDVVFGSAANGDEAL